MSHADAPIPSIVGKGYRMIRWLQELRLAHKFLILGSIALVMAACVLIMKWRFRDGDPDGH